MGTADGSIYILPLTSWAALATDFSGLTSKEWAGELSVGWTLKTKGLRSTSSALWKSLVEAGLQQQL